MVRLFNVYYPVRTLVLVCGETAIVLLSFALAAWIRLGGDSLDVLRSEDGILKIISIAALSFMCFYYFDLYEPQRLPSSGETYFRVLIVIGVLSLLLGALGYFIPSFLLSNNIVLLGVTILTISVLCWRWLYILLIRQPFLRERVYVLGAGERAERLVEALRSRVDLGLEIVGWPGAIGNGSLNREQIASQLLALKAKNAVDRVIVAMTDRRGTMPVRELLDLRLSGIKVEEATALLERVSGRIDIYELQPSWLIFAEGFSQNAFFMTLRRLMSLVISLACLMTALPLIPLVALAIKLTSAGPVLYRQKRVGRNGRVFTCYKFRTMRADAEADTGATWALDDDPRITRVGRVMRYLRLDEIPQIWNVFTGDMGFVGPRPERPEFVEKLVEQIPYYNLRHIIRPGITGWAQIRYKYGNTIEDARQKLQYDLFYVKNISLGLDFWIMVQTVKVILLGRGAQ